MIEYYKESIYYNKSGLNLKINRPNIIVSDIDIVPYNKKDGVDYAVKSILDGHFVLIQDFFSSGLEVLRKLKQVLQKKYKQDFNSQREFRNEYHKLSHKLLVYVLNSKIQLRKVPEIEWINKLYPDVNEFLIAFPDLQGLNSSWQWYVNGIKIPKLKNKIFPYYDVYFPTRFDHIILFNEYLENNIPTTAMDIGVGSGVLSYLMLQKGTAKVYASDINSNAIIGLNERENKDDKMILSCSDLFDDFKDEVDLIVFNPPWIPSPKNSHGIDNAIYYDDKLFDRFFSEAYKHLKQNARIAILFSNLAIINNQTDVNPIKQELENNDRYILHEFLSNKVEKASSKTKRNQYWRDNELVELWILKKK